MLAFLKKVCYYIEVAGNGAQKLKNPGVAKFGIALEWGSRGLEFESRHSDQKSPEIVRFQDFLFVFRSNDVLGIYSKSILTLE